MKETLLKVENLKVNFDSYLGEAEVLDNVSFNIKKNSWFGLAGESGCGKSVTAFSILKLLPESAKVKNGKILFKGVNILKKGERQMQKVRGREISIVFQEPQEALNPSMRIGDHIVETLKIHRRISSRDAKEYAIDMLGRVKISYPKARFRQYPHELSGGMQQRVCIALALLCSPSLLIADEFTTSLDVTVEEEIIDLVLDLQKEINMSVLFITHDLALIYKSCDYVTIMYAGQVVENGMVDKVFKSPSHPYTKALLDSIPTVTEDKKRLKSISGSVPSLINPPKGCRFHTRCKYKISGVCDKNFPKSTRLSDGHKVWCHLLK